MRGRVARALAGASVLLALTVAGATPALAECEQTDIEQLFVNAENRAGEAPLRVGTLARILLRNRDLDQDCPGARQPGDACDDAFYGAVTVSTAHMRPGIVDLEDRGKWIEIGWAEVWHSNDTSSQDESLKDWYVFAEKGVDFACTQFTSQLAPNLDPGTDDIWRISGDGAGTWTLSVNFAIGQGYVDFETYHTNWGKGVPLAETERFGNGTGMADHQYNLQWKTATGWNSWVTNDCYLHVDNTGGQWDYDFLSDTAFDIDHAGVFC
jgi:hypothetical protein